jgi:hypothetical protein
MITKANGWLLAFAGVMLLESADAWSDSTDIESGQFFELQEKVYNTSDTK